MSDPKDRLDELLAAYERPEELLRDLSLALIEERLAEDDFDEPEADADESEPATSSGPAAVLAMPGVATPPA